MVTGGDDEEMEGIMRKGVDREEGRKDEIDRVRKGEERRKGGRDGKGREK